MKVFTRLATAITGGALALILSGCVTSEAAVNVNADGTFEMTLEQSFSKEDYGTQQGVTDGKLIIADLEASVEEKYPDLDYKITEKGENIHLNFELEGLYTKDETVTLPDGEPFPFPITLNDVGEQKAMFSFDLPLYAQTQGLPDEESFKNYYSDFTMSVTFPGVIEVTNGSWNKETNTATWDMEHAIKHLNEDTIYKALGGIPDPNDKIVVYIIGGVTGAIGLTGLVILLVNRSRKKA